MAKIFSDVLRSAIKDSALTMKELSAKTGVPQPRICVFMQGKDIRLKTAEKLASYLRLELKPR